LTPNANLIPAPSLTREFERRVDLVFMVARDRFELPFTIFLCLFLDMSVLRLDTLQAPPKYRVLWRCQKVLKLLNES
jgi:hypothetical protein